MGVDFNDMAIALNGFKLGIISRATGSTYDNSEYEAIRSHLLSRPEIKHLIPSFVKSCHTTDEFWSYIQPKFEKYAQRREYIASELNPLIEFYENNKDVFSLNIESDMLGEEIGHGGYGKVYKYHHQLLDMLFAVKVFEPLFALESDVIEGEKRFFREAKMLFHLQHENIATVYDIRLEYIEGQNLGEWIRKMGGVSFERSKKPIHGILKGLNFAHERRVIHRDLKPSNIMVKKDGTIKIIDFGISAYVETADHTRLTKTGEQISGGRYADPRLANEPSLRDVRSDIYSIGALWFFILTNRDPSNDAKNVLINSGNATPAQADIILRCLNSNADERFQSCKEILELIFDDVGNLGGSKRISANNITLVTKKSIIKYFIERKYAAKDSNFTPEFYYYGDLGAYDFLSRLFELDTIPSTSSEYENLHDEIQAIVEKNNELDRESESNWNNYSFQEYYNDNYHHIGWQWLFSDDKFSLIKNEDDLMLRFLCDIFHPEVRDWFDEKIRDLCIKIIDSLNIYLREDGYEIYEESKISGRPVYSYRYCL